MDTSPAMDATHELGRFLRSRRARLTPEAVGLPEYGPRRVPGLRREEVAALAGVSGIYYTRLEQGRAANPSEAVLNALARVLRLDPVEHAHLRDLARPRRAAAPAAAQRVRPGVRRMLEAVGAVPAYVMGPDMEVLAANRLATVLIAGPGPAPARGAEQDGEGEPFPAPPHSLPAGLNLARHVFLDPAARDLYPQWEEIARQTVAFLRFSAGRYGGLPRFAALIDELSAASAEFRGRWAAREIREKTYGTKRLRHRVVGEFELHYETVGLPGDEGQALVVFAADPGTPADTALRLLGSWAADTPGVGRTGGRGPGGRVLGDGSKA
ncbi:helix-turn-helix transcriptional regulator [Kitasatospora sp. NPDC094015]|uniref:helix-turn-helix transcriptional regulator n=1 Tax=Kitasatospora sp. NPDC094015 TaxID=3155205 RepID=UPI003318422F